MSELRRSLQGSIVALVVVLVGACASGTESGAELGMAPLAPGRGLDDLILVDCLLPGQVRQLGQQLTYLSPRRLVKSTKSDCAIRGGEFVLFDRSDYKTALATLLPKARAGDPVVQTYVGEIYEKGLGLPAPDYSQAAEWYRRAADQGHVPAQIYLGSLYERGLGVSKDKGKALDLYRHASGIADDPLIFESKLKAEREAFQRELAVRNQLAANLRAQLQRARAGGAAAAPARPAPSSAPKQPTEPKPQSAPMPEPKPQHTPAPKTQPTSAAPADLNAAELDRQAKSQLLDAQSEAERIDKELRAIEALKQSDTGKAKAAQLGKLELARREQRRLLLETAQQLSQIQTAGGAM
ncbi:sel1 repeat family protein [Caldichromatium japonicum]|uniref:Sel1 repeat family protein n=1 Tax=Caldichromatium japonicum TaxID=2699430 RepID=A0A6G7VFB2_9GAMM|nr:tetratricopeptide repeat protein [Caldichromatium japonicum]QIK38773.1 sel1 repeat family protein [Caldichromatium japonicum]